VQLEIKFKSIAVRWFFNMFLIVALIVSTVIIAFSVFFSSVYTERVEVMAGDLTYEFNSLSSATPKSFKDKAVELAGDFQYKTKLEVQVIDRHDNIIVTTTGFQPTDQRMPDYERAKKNGETAAAKIKSANGERVLACTTVIYDAAGRYMGAYRWITSLNAVNRTVSGFVLVLVLAGILVLGFCAFSGLFFINSIVRPIRDVSNIARKIAMGDFNSRIEIKKNDEIGELCDTINYMASELSEAENLKNDFISSVSHELRTPLTAIKGWGETAKMSLGTDEALVKRGLDVVLSEADRLSGLVEELLDFSRMETGYFLRSHGDLCPNDFPLPEEQICRPCRDLYRQYRTICHTCRIRSCGRCQPNGRKNSPYIGCGGDCDNAKRQRRVVGFGYNGQDLRLETGSSWRVIQPTDCYICE